MQELTLKLVRRLPGWLSLHEGQFLEKAAKRVINLRGVVVEIGSFQGKSTIWLAQTRQTVYAIDPHRGKFSGGASSPTYQAFLTHLRQAGVSPYVKPLVKTSRAAARGWREPIKLLFVDGLHDEVNAHRDFELWSPRVVTGGIIAMHDSFCGWEGAEKVAREKIVNSDNFREIGVVGSITYGVKGQPNFWQGLDHWRCRLLIRLGLRLHRQKFLPRWLSFWLVQRLIKLGLLNRFTLPRLKPLYQHSRKPPRQTRGMN
ncbi:MAG: class I SAM-dependent methyltransferase [Patescibacteria group bacterium]